MKRAIVALLLFFVLIFALPLLILKSCTRIEEKKINEFENLGSINITVYNTAEDKLVETSLEEYVLGVLAGEMPSEFHIEALKAQALAARTYTLMRTRAFGGDGCSAHPGADVCTDFTHCQAYKDPKTITFNLEKYKKAVLDTKGEVIVYNHALIDAVFHSTSGGKTENSEEVWSSRVPYLRSVISEYEEHSPKLITKKEIKVSDFIAAIKKLDSSIKLTSKNIKSQIKVLDRSEGGRIKTIQIGEKTLSGSAVRGALGLNSSNFSIAYSGDVMTFTVIGNGHGIGLSQYGADGMAKNGSLYKDIILHYYQGVEIITVEELLEFQEQSTFQK